MELSEYQMKTQLTAVYKGSGNIAGLLYAALGLAGETGELCNKLKKVLRDSDGDVTEEARLKMLDELGDVLWYCAAVATELKASLNIVAETNLAKLANRYAENKIHGSGDSR